MIESDAPEDRDFLAREAWKRVLHLTSGEATKGDITDLERWCAENPHHADAYAKAAAAWHSFGPAAENAARRSGPASVRRADEFKIHRTVSRRAVLGGAALVSVTGAGGAFAVAHPLLGLWPSLSELTADYRTAAGEQRRVQLSGHVSVEMNTRTSLDIRPMAGHRDRVELIAGEALITTQSRPVEATAAQGRVLADNAQFNMRYYGSSVCVTCLTGAVHVEHDRQTTRLQQQEQVIYTASSIGPMSIVDPTLVVGWREGDLYFKNEPLIQVIDEINRYRSGRIILMNRELGQRRITAHFKLDRLGVIITQLKETFGARVTVLPGGVVLVA